MAGVALRPYQRDDVVQLEQRLRELASLGVEPHSRRVLYVLPTGGGKTVVAAELAGHRIGWCSCAGGQPVQHSPELASHSSRRCIPVRAASAAARVRLQAQVLVVAYRHEPRKALEEELMRRFGACGRDRVIVATVHELYRQVKRQEHGLGLDNVKLVIVDEAHHISEIGKMYTKVIGKCTSAEIIGLTATPFRGDRELARWRRWFRPPLLAGATIEQREQVRALSHEILTLTLNHQAPGPPPPGPRALGPLRATRLQEGPPAGFAKNVPSTTTCSLSYSRATYSASFSPNGRVHIA